MDDSPNPIASMFGGAGTIFTGSPNSPAPTFNVAESFGLDGPAAMLVNMGIQSFLPSLFGNKGDIFPQFSPQIGFAEQLRRQSNFAMQQDVMRQASALDEATYQKILQGVANISGTPFGDREKRAAATMAKDLATFMPILAQLAPDAVDRLHGARGSSFVMAQQIGQAARFAQDPNTGAIGLSAKSFKELTTNFYNQLYGKDADLTQMRGITAGQAGAMFEQMTRRGLVGTREVNLEELARAEGKTLEELGKLPDFSSKVQQLQSGRAVERIKAMAGAVAAMKDIFGENGQANAPMAQIFNALQAVTQNNLGNMQPAQVERIVRDMHNAAKISGLDLQGMMAVNAMAGQVTDRFGLDRSFAPEIATRAPIAAAAFGNMMGNARIFGMIDKEKMLQVQANLMGAASSSTEANEAAALLRLSKTGQLTRTPETEELFKYIEQLENPEAQNITPIMSTKLRELVIKAGVTEGDFGAAVREVDRNQPIIQSFKLGPRVGTAAQELQNKAGVATGLEQAALATLGKEKIGFEKIDVDKRKEVFNQITNELFKADPEVFSDLQQMKYDGKAKPLIDKVKKVLTDAGASVEDTDVKTFIDKGMAILDERAKVSGYQNAAGMVLLNSDQFTRYNEIAQQQVKEQTEMDIKLSQFGRGTPAQRVVETLIQNRGNKDFTFNDFIRGAFGAKSSEEIEKALGPGFKEFRNRDNRDFYGDVLTLMNTAVVGKVDPKNEQLNKVAAAYNLTPEDLSKMSGKTQAEVQTTLNQKRHVAQMQYFETIRKSLEGAGLLSQDNIDAPFIPAPEKSAVADMGKSLFKSITKLLPVSDNEIAKVFGKTAEIAKKVIPADQLKALTQVATLGKSPELVQVLPAVEAVQEALLPAPIKSIADAAKTLFTPPKPTKPASFDFKTVTDFLGKTFSFSSGKQMATELDKSDQKKQETLAQREKEREEKAVGKVQTVRLEGGTELSGTLNIVTEDIVMQIPQTQKI